jgi:endonuclease YncB( thermonuclease family)
VRMFTYDAIVWRIIDADTVEVSIDLGFHIWHLVKVRLIGLDAPERFTEEGKAATQFTRDLLEGEFVTITTYKPDKYGRYLAEIFIKSGDSFNKLLLDTGHAVPYDGGVR